MLQGRMGRVIQVGRKWQRITLTDEEENEVLDWLRKRNLRMFQQCLQDAEQLAKDKAHVTSVAIALFNHLALGAHTAIDEALEARMHELKEQASAGATATAESPEARKHEEIRRDLEALSRLGIEKTHPAVQKALKELAETMGDSSKRLLDKKT